MQNFNMCLKDCLLSRVQKQMLGDVISTIIETAVEGVEKPELAAATTKTIGGVKQAATVAVLETTDEITDVISTVKTTFYYS